jgi:phosphate transport system substrate-binding protein
MTIKPSRSWILLVLAGVLALSLVLVGCGKQLSGTVTEGGSTTVQPLAQALADAFQLKHPDVSISIAGGGTGAGITGANNGTFDIGAASRDLKSGEPALIKQLLARDGIGIITNPDNPVTGLTKAQVIGIFSGAITKWQDVGWADGPDITVYVRESGSGTRTAFQDLVMGSENITSSALEPTSSGAMKQRVHDDPSAIGFESLAYVDTSIRALAIDDVAATEANAKDGTYPIVRPLYFLTKEQPTGLVKDFIDFCQSTEGQQIVAENGYIAVT